MPKLPFEKKQRLRLKAKEKTNPNYGCPPEKRPIQAHIEHGIINLDKPSGPTSHEVVAWTRKILGVEKAGHGGTLDPRVSGVLPVALGKATKITRTLLFAGKEYVCVMHLHKEVDQAHLEKTRSKFIGEIYQVPPVRSAVKRRKRKRHIYYLEVLERSGRNVLLKVGCEAGTYMRKLIHDIGKALGVGAHMSELRRTQIGPFKEDETLTTLQTLTDAYHFWKEDKEEQYLRKTIQPLEKGLAHLPKIIIRDSAVDAICHGADLAAPGVLQVTEGIKPGDPITIFTQKNEAVALAKSKTTTKQILQKNHGIIAETKRVVMEPNTYPKLWK